MQSASGRPVSYSNRVGELFTEDAGNSASSLCKECGDLDAQGPVNRLHPSNTRPHHH